MGRMAHAAVPARADHDVMNDCGSFHRIEDDLSETWVEEWAGTGVTAIETYLAKHLAFQTYLEATGAA